ncbi:MAG: hypothetical protein BJ554DRAFT_2569, partial [Olpidium bornovanus]
NSSRSTSNTTAVRSSRKASSIPTSCSTPWTTTRSASSRSHRNPRASARRGYKREAAILRSTASSWYRVRKLSLLLPRRRHATGRCRRELQAAFPTSWPAVRRQRGCRVGARTGGRRRCGNTGCPGRACRTTRQKTRLRAPCRRRKFPKGEEGFFFCGVVVCRVRDNLIIT